MHKILCRLTLVLLALLPLTARAQTTIPVSGHVADSSQGIPAGMSIKFELYNCGANYPRVVGSFGIVRQNFTLTPSLAGLLTGTIVPNDIINCGGITGTTRYNVTLLLNGIPQAPTACYAVLSTMGVFNLDTATPCASATPPPPPGGPYDATYNNLNLLGLLTGNNANFTGAVTADSFRANSFHFNSTPFACPSGQYSIGLDINFVTQCLTLPSVSFPVTSVFGRTGNVTAANGDYICSMVTGSICSLPTVNYQQIGANGTSQTARGRLNLISSGSASISCADNGGTNSTDCTISVTGGSDSPTTCNANGCFYTKADGTKVEWGVSSAVPTGADQNVVVVTFPLAFSSTTSPMPLSFVAFADNCSDTCGSVSPKNPIAVSGTGNLSTFGATVSFTGVTPVGGGGSTLNTTIHARWQAIGK